MNEITDINSHVFYNSDQGSSGKDRQIKEWEKSLDVLLESQDYEPSEKGKNASEQNPYGSQGRGVPVEQAFQAQTSTHPLPQQVIAASTYITRTLADQIPATYQSSHVSTADHGKILVQLPVQDAPQISKLRQLAHHPTLKEFFTQQRIQAKTDDNRLTLWVRDYFSSGTQLEQIIKAVKAHAQELGLKELQITINGVLQKT